MGSFLRKIYATIDFSTLEMNTWTVTDVPSFFDLQGKQKWLGAKVSLKIWKDETHIKNLKNKRQLSLLSLPKWLGTTGDTIYIPWEFEGKKERIVFKVNRATEEKIAEK